MRTHRPEITSKSVRVKRQFMIFNESINKVKIIDKSFLIGLTIYEKQVITGTNKHLPWKCVNLFILYYAITSFGELSCNHSCLQTRVNAKTHPSQLSQVKSF